MNKGDRRLARRAFLRAMGVGAAVLPLLEAERASAQSAVPQAKRFIFMGWPDGMLNRDEDWPAAGTNFVLPDFMQSLEAHRNELLLLKGINYRFIRDSADISERTGHAAYPGMLTGATYSQGGNSTANDIAGGISLDQYLGNALRAQGYDGLTSLNLGVKIDSTARLCWRGAGANNAIVPNEDPYDAFNSLFGGARAAADAAPDPALTRVNTMRKSILDYVIGDLGRFSASLGVSDRQRIEAHVQSVRELEQTLQVTARANSGAVPELPQGVNVGSTVNFHTTTEMQMKIIAAAFAADTARTAALQLGDQGGANIVLTTLGFDANNRETSGNTGLVQGLHVIAHDDGADKRRTDGFFQEQISKFIQLLKDTSDGAGTLMDSTALLAMSNMRTGNHQTNELPAVLAGRMGGYFSTGRSLALNDAPNNGILIAIANAMGVPTTTFGSPQYGGELAALRG